jgi:hypothetical protein
LIVDQPCCVVKLHCTGKDWDFPAMHAYQSLQQQGQQEQQQQQA